MNPWWNSCTTKHVHLLTSNKNTPQQISKNKRRNPITFNIHAPPKKKVTQTHPSCPTPPVWWWFRTSKWIDPHPPRPRCYHKAHPGRSIRRQKLPQWSETEKKKSFPWLTEKKGIPENLKTSNLASNFLCIFFLAFLMMNQSQFQQIQWWNIQQQPKKGSWICSVVRPIISTVRWMFFTCKSSLLPEIGQGILLKKSTNAQLVIEVYHPRKPSLRNGLSTWESAWIQTTDWHSLKMWLENNICCSSNSSVVWSFRKLCKWNGKSWTFFVHLSGFQVSINCSSRFLI